MRILYFDWNEFTGPDCREAMTRLGHTVGIWRHLWNCRSVDEEFSYRTEQALFCRNAAGESGRDYGGVRETAPQWDVVFSFNFYPAISEVCERSGVPYISWTFDSPYLPVTSKTNRNRVNTIYLFDRALAEKMRAEGIDTVRYLPLAVNSRRMREVRERFTPADNGYAHEISFVGGLYADKNNFYNAIAGDLPVFLRSYLEDVLHLQTGVYGRDLIGDPLVVTDEMLEDLRAHIRFEVPDVYAIDYDELLRDMLRTQATEMDRFSLLEALGREHPARMDLYTRWDSPALPGVRNCGYASYLEKMPQVFRTSRVNLNITLRTIRTGMPLRALDVMAAGGFLLSTRQQELDEYFENGRDLALAGDPEEMLFLADWFFEHDAEREKIAERGCARVCEQFDYEKVLREQVLKGIN
ncbi:MAG: DUF3880 domain-containing protein [Lachnospiraceae bacterium]|nr:DUF3880 domain-containing protein [Lachnospiraceae bacterium]